MLLNQEKTEVEIVVAEAVAVLVAEVVAVLAAEDLAVVAEEENTSIWYIRLEGCLIIQTAFFFFYFEHKSIICNIV